MDKITFYDFNNLYYSSFYISGFIENCKKIGIKFSISHYIPEILRKSEMSEKRVFLFGICLFRAEIKGKEFWFCIDTHDGRKAHSYNFHLLKEVKYYFKVNYNRSALDQNECNKKKENMIPSVAENRQKIKPIPPFSPIRKAPLIKYLPWYFPKLSPSPVVNWGYKDILRRFKQLNNIMPLDGIRQLRNSPRRSNKSRRKTKENC